MVLALTTFWDVFFLLLIWVPLIMLWGFALYDIFRRHDMAGLSKALWVAVIFLLPYIGVLIYLGMRPEGPGPGPGLA
jgi:hypothetical protein